MNLIKTCYGEWINPTLVKHFSVNYTDYNGKDFVDVRADGVTIQTFKVEVPPDHPERPKNYRYFSRDERTKADDDAYDAAYKKWRDAYNENQRKTRAEACAWLAELVKKLHRNEPTEELL